MTPSVCVEYGNHRVFVFGLSGKFLKSWGSKGTSDGQFSDPLNICVFNGEVFVVDNGTHRVCVFNRKGEFLRKWGVKGTADGQLEAGIKSICVTNGGLVYITENNQNKVSIFDTNGVFKGKLDIPSPCSVCARGDRIVVCAVSVIRLYDLKGSILKEFSSQGSQDGQINCAYGCVWVGDKLLISDSSNHRVQVFH